MTKTHQLSRTPEWVSWSHMRQRCKNPNTTRYKDWGGRGLGICAEWDSFEVFLEDMGNKPSLAHSLDRIDNSKGYFPDNCRWATSTEQNNNRRSNTFYTHEGRTLTLTQWAKVAGLTKTGLKYRLSTGVSFDKVIAKGRFRRH